MEACTRIASNPYSIAESGLRDGGWQPEKRWIDRLGHRRQIDPDTQRELGPDEFETSIWRKPQMEFELSVVRAREVPGECLARFEAAKPDAIIGRVAEQLKRPPDFTGRKSAGGDWLVPRDRRMLDSAVWRLSGHDVHIDFDGASVSLRILAMPQTIRQDPNSPYSLERELIEE
ncbi:MAG: hypothetical protein JJ901_03205 [Erythrobacter sp.]|uniref:hypothetical protein n=1 Tax=Erythrobacter sp. TaxID=1042 RepID=UPI001B091657|nr:hypothetical protein [Erythrobacter sp.]MBO6767297.1 hypothetical protein [Erythrobacter sp.]